MQWIKNWFLGLLIVLLTVASVNGQVYVQKKDASEYRIYQRVKYAGSTPNLPLWQVNVIRKNLINNATANSYPDYIGDVWGWVGPYCCAFTSTTATDYRIIYGTGAEGGGGNLTDWILYDTSGSAVDAEDDWSPNTADFGTADDGETPTSSRPHARTDGGAGSAGAYAEITVVVPATWTAATLDTNIAYVANGNVAGQTIWTLYWDDSGTWRQIPLNGRGAMTNQWNFSGSDGKLGIASFRGVPVWDVNGTADQAQQSSDANVNCEVARDLKPGTYKLRAKTTVDANRVNVGRTRLHREDPSLTPMSTNAVEYFVEYAMDTQGSLNRPGPYMSAWTSSIDLEIKHNSDASLYANGPNYGFNRQTSMTLTGDGADLTGITIGQFYGPYASVVFTPTDHITRSDPTVSGTANATVTQGNPVVQLPASTNLTADMVGDYVFFGKAAGSTPRADGINNGRYFQITAYNDPSDQITVSPTPTAVGTSSDWGIHSTYVSCVKTYTFRDQKMRFSVNMDWLKDTTVARLYIGNWRPFGMGAHQNWFGFIPRHPTNVYPYNGTKVEYIDTRRGLPTWSFDMVLPSKKIHKKTSDASHLVSTTGASSTITFGASTDLSAAVAGDSIYITDHTDGMDGSTRFVLLTVTDASDIATVSPTPTQTIANSTWVIGASRDQVYTASMESTTPLTADRRVFHYSQIPQSQNRGVGRVAVVDSDWWNWVGDNFLTNGVSGFSLGSEDMKCYNTAISGSTRTAAGANSVFSFELFIAEASYVTNPSSGGTNSLRLGF